MGCTNGHPLTAEVLAALATVASLVIGFVVGGGALDASRSRTAQVSDSQIGMLVGHGDRHRRDPVHWGWVAVASRAYCSWSCVLVQRGRACSGGGGTSAWTLPNSGRVPACGLNPLLLPVAENHRARADGLHGPELVDGGANHGLQLLG